MLTNTPNGVGLKHYNDCKAFIEYWNKLDDIYENIGEYNTNKECQMLTVFDDVTSDMLNK